MIKVIRSGLMMRDLNSLYVVVGAKFSTTNIKRKKTHDMLL